MSTWNEEEDGMGFAGLVPSRAERQHEKALTHAYAEGRKDEREQWATVLEALQAITTMCEVAGDFSNGVTDPTGTIDEGVVRSGEVISAARVAITKVAPE